MALKKTSYIQPMLATLAGAPFSSKDWIFEMKLDGYRAIAEIRQGKVKLYSRNGISFATRFPSLYESLRKIRKTMIIDGEIVMLDKNGKPDFQQLQNYTGEGEFNPVFYVFDLLHLGRYSYTRKPLLERKVRLKKELPGVNGLLYCSHVPERGEAFFSEIKKYDLEGMVAKRADSLYHPGTRSRNWLKIKNHRSMEAVIAGYTAPKGERQGFGSLLLGQYAGDELTFIGHAGTGFSEDDLASLMKKMKPLERKSSPFPAEVSANQPVTWVEPVLVAEVGFSEITRNGQLRHPVFKRLREDKKAKQVKKSVEQS